MSRELASDEKKAAKQPKPMDQALDKQRPTGPGPNVAGVLNLQQKVGNQAVQRLLAQRSSEDGFDLDGETTNRINQARGGGQALEGPIQKQMGQAMGHDFSGVRVHTSSESDTLNQQLGAKAFTTGQDIFFKQGEYNPGSSSGNELLAHELTHVIQQSSGKVENSDSGMTVRPAGDAYEQEADAMAKQVTNTSGDVQMKTDGTVQREEMLEEEMQTKRDETIQREGDEDELLMKRDETVQREEMPEEEMQTKRDETVQREGDEDELLMKRDEAVQREDTEEEVV